MTIQHARQWTQPEREKNRSMKMEGWPASACPGCGVKVQPGQMTTYAPKGHPGPAEGNGDVWPWHTRCLSPICPWCGAEHTRPYDGGCLL